MKVFLGSDHGGFALKQRLFEHLVKQGYDVEDVGDKELDPNDDYPQFAYAATTKVLGSEDKDARAILICKGGRGMAIAANRVRGIRAVVVWDKEEAEWSRADNNANVLCLPARIMDENDAEDVVDTWLETEFSGASRHKRRLAEIEELYG